MTQFKLRNHLDLILFALFLVVLIWGATVLNGVEAKPVMANNGCSDPNSILPVILVHGWNSEASSWNEYKGFLENIGEKVYAIDTMNTGKNYGIN